MPLRIALERMGGEGSPSPTYALEDTLEEFQQGREENKVLDFIVIEGQLADALELMFGIGDDAMISQFEEILDQVYSMGRRRRKQK